jgi:antitoxin VapB
MTKTNVSKPNKPKTAPSPQAGAFPDDVMRLNITHRDKKKSIVSADSTWTDFFAGSRLGDDFLNERNQPTAQKRRILRCP